MMLILIVAGALVAINLASIIIAGFRIRVRSTTSINVGMVTVIRPVCGLDQYDVHTLASTFQLNYPDVEIIFCAASEDDPAIQVVRRLINEYRDAMVTEPMLLIGESAISANPKLNNLVKGWQAAQGRWVVMADSNVMLPPDTIERLLACWGSTTGLVCSPPLASRPRGFWAELECAFLNTYQARWQFVADAVGLGFAQGKVMLWNRGMLNSWGGIETLAEELAEDAAATKVVRRAGLKVHLVDAPFPQPLGHRAFREVFDRQMRWAVLRRKTFPVLFAAELASTVVVPAALMLSSGWLAPAIMLGATLMWYGAEMMLAWSKGWHVSVRSPLAFAVRDFLILIVYVGAWLTDGFSWRGNQMSVRG